MNTGNNRRRYNNRGNYNRGRGSREQRDALDQFRQAWQTEQETLRKSLIRENDLSFDVPLTKNLYDATRQKSYEGAPANPEQTFLIAAVNVSFNHKKRDKNRATVGLAVFKFPSLRKVYSKVLPCRLTKPYISGFLAFREIEHLQTIIKTMKDESDLSPDIIMVNACGVLHPRRFGLASHLGVVCGIPTIGIAKKLLFVRGLRDVDDKIANDLKKPGDFTRLVTDNGEELGAVLRTSGDLYISIGHKISLTSAIFLVASCVKDAMLYPMPLHEVDSLTRSEYRDSWKNKNNNRRNDEMKETSMLVNRLRRAVESLDSVDESPSNSNEAQKQALHEFILLQKMHIKELGLNHRIIDKFYDDILERITSKTPHGQQTTTSTAPSRKLCQICTNEEVSRAILPCGHLCLCADCDLEGADPLCPMCRESIEEIVDIQF